MRLFEFSNNDIDLNEFINAKCSNALIACKRANGFLYHGSGKAKWHQNTKELEQNYVISVTTERIPVHHWPNAEEKLIDAGFTALRTNSIFCIGRLDVAKQFGEPYVIFPFDNSSFTWSEKFAYYFSDDPEMGFVGPERYDEEIRHMSSEQFVKYFKIRKDNLSDAIMSEHEIYIHGQFLAIKYSAYDFNFWKNLLHIN